MVEDASWRADDDVHALTHESELLVKTLAAVDRHGLAVPAGKQLAGLFTDLHDQFAGGGQDDGLGPGSLISRH